ncbi:hypothetical protein SAMN05421821_12077 [Mucilaginibacter lappiensis]|uniref:Uncharacterized protein n=1 Tax=Mucilaginibacter lappiensis TaxID=354630 RepID=A0ABR6PS49_9SPHI|nr:hypothetical protein [Mucilaginibacter lappiensis]MBB6112610.1 hypothetical protein [Mucilaginibacter lappiensis]SIS05026.1 hypothetical protein SAMN05421821_12077 [Mucilaginibacter lappiensis]
MRTENEIRSKIEEFNINLAIIQSKMEKELEKHFMKRDKHLLLFLHKEKSIWEFALVQLHWLLSDEVDKKELKYESL